MESVSLVAVVKNREIEYDKTIQYRNFVNEIEEGKNVFIKIAKIRKQRSLAQNDYLHWIFRFIGDFYGSSEDTIKEIMKHKFLPKIIIYSRTGKEFQVPRSTADLNTVEMMVFIDRIRKFWWDFDDFYIPLPEELAL